MVRPQQDQQLLYLGWRETLELLRKLARWIETAFAQDPIVLGIERGGATIVQLLKYHTEMIVVHDPIHILTNLEARKDCLVIDDITDSGETFEKLVDQLTGGRTVFTATLMRRHTSTYTPTFSAYVLPHKRWIVFPWERTVKELVDINERAGGPKSYDDEPKQEVKG